MRKWIEEAWWAWGNGISFRFINYNDNIDRLAFFEEINCGWYQMYIYPYDDMYFPVISNERKTRLDEYPPIIYLSQEDYDALIERINQPPDPSVVERLKQLMNRKTPWE